MLTSTRFQVAYPQPDRSDSADAPRDFGSVVTGLEKAMMYGQGTLAARPAAAIQGRYYYATDIGVGYYDTGAAWVVPAANTINGYAVSPGASVVSGFRYTPTAITAGQVAFGSNVSGEPFYRFFIDPNGVFNWGSGAIAGDTTLYRNSANFLITGGNLWAGNNTTPGNASISAVASGDGWARVGLQNNSMIVFGPGTSSTDTNLYRSAAGILKTDGDFTAANVATTNNSTAAGYTYNPASAGGTLLYSIVQGATNQLFSIDYNGTMHWGSGSAAVDVNLYRANTALNTDTGFVTGNSVTGGGFLQIIASSSGNPITILQPGDSQPRMQLQAGANPTWAFGPGGATATDTSFQRTAAGKLQMAAGNIFQADHQTSVASVTTARTGGAAAALPTAPVRYLAFRDENGNRMYVPAYS